MIENKEHSSNVITLDAHYEDMLSMSLEQLTVLVRQLTNANGFTLAQIVDVIKAFAYATEQATPEQSLHKDNIASVIMEYAQDRIYDFCAERAQMVLS